MPPRDEVAARRARVLQLRAAGLSFQAIAEQVGHRSASAAAQDAARALKDRKHLLDDQAALAVTLEAERLDALERAAQAVLQTSVRGGDHETALRSVDRLVRLSDRRGRLLGLSSTTKTQAGTVERKVRADIAALVTAHPMGEALAEMSYNLARVLDEGAGLATAAVNRELRANLTELGRLAVDDDDTFEADLSTPRPAEVRHPPES